MQKSKSGFTLVELMIVIVVIVILATITAVAYTGTQARARDTARKSDLADIAEAVQLYRQKCGNDVQGASNVPTCGNDGAGHSGCGSSGGGSGWFNYAGGSYPNSTLSCLQAAGFLDGSSTSFVDPSGCTTNGNNASGSPLGYCHQIGGSYGYTYMKYSTGSGDTSLTCVYAHLETEDNSATLKSSSSPCYSAGSATVANNYGMNYQVVVK